MLCCCPKEVVSLCPPACPHPPPSNRFHPHLSPTSVPGSDSKVCQQNLLTQQNRRGKAASFPLPWQGPVSPTQALWNCSLKPSSPFLSATTVTDRFSHPAPRVAPGLPGRRRFQRQSRTAAWSSCWRNLPEEKWPRAPHRPQTVTFEPLGYRHTLDSTSLQEQQEPDNSPPLYIVLRKGNWVKEPC